MQDAAREHTEELLRRMRGRIRARDALSRVTEEFRQRQHTSRRSVAASEASARRTAVVHHGRFAAGR